MAKKEGEQVKFKLSRSVRCIGFLCVPSCLFPLTKGEHGTSCDVTDLLTLHTNLPSFFRFNPAGSEQRHSYYPASQRKGPEGKQYQGQTMVFRTEYLHKTSWVKPTGLKEGRTCHKQAHTAYYQYDELVTSTLQDAPSRLFSFLGASSGHFRFA